MIDITKSSIEELEKHIKEVQQLLGEKIVEKHKEEKEAFKEYCELLVGKVCCLKTNNYNRDLIRVVYVDSVKIDSYGNATFSVKEYFVKEFEQSVSIRKNSTMFYQWTILNVLMRELGANIINMTKEEFDKRYVKVGNLISQLTKF